MITCSPYSVPLSDDADGDDPEGEMQAELSGQNWQVQRNVSIGYDDDENTEQNQRKCNDNSISKLAYVHVLSLSCYIVIDKSLILMLVLIQYQPMLRRLKVQVKIQGPAQGKLQGWDKQKMVNLL